MRPTATYWWCKRGNKNDHTVRVCPCCQSLRFERHAQVHSSERAVVYLNPTTGEHRTPPRADMPMPEAYARQGFERHEIMRMTDWEKQSGVVHEATNFNPGNEMPSEKPVEVPHKQELIRALTTDIADAAASGPWTGADRLIDGV